MTEEIKFREEFEKEIENLDETVKEAIFNATQKFLEIRKEKKSLQILWFMTMESFRGVKELGLNLEGCESINNMPKIPRRILIKFRDELFYQKSIRNSGFLNIHTIIGCEEAYQELLDTTKDIVLSVKVYNACYRLCKYYSDEEVQHTLFLLSYDDNDTFMFGGIRSLHFGREATKMLIPYVKEIYNLLKKMSQKCIKYNEFKRIADAIEIANNQNDEEQQNIISAEDVINDIPLFREFIQIIEELEERGYDMYDVLDNIELIEELLKITESDS